MKEQKEGIAFQEVLMKIESIDIGMASPPYEKQKGEQELGVVTDKMLKKLFILGQLESREADKLEVDIKYETDSANSKILEASRRSATWLSDASLGMFWYCLRLTHDLFDYDNIGMRRGWVIVIPNDRKHPVEQFLEKLSGQ